MVKRELRNNEYRIRREQCQEGLRLLARRLPRVCALRDITLPDLTAFASEMPEVLYRRCHHVVSENSRVKEIGKWERGGKYKGGEGPKMVPLAEHGSRSFQDKRSGALAMFLISGAPVIHPIALIPQSSANQAAGSIKFCADEDSSDKTRTRRRFVKKSKPHCRSTNRRLANPMRK